MINVPDVQSEFIRPRQRIPSEDLHHSGDPWPHFVTARLLTRVALHVDWQKMTRPHERHVASKNVPQLGQLIERGIAEELAKSRQPRFIGLSAIQRHRPKLEEDERTAMSASPCVAEENGGAHEAPHQECD